MPQLQLDRFAILPRNGQRSCRPIADHVEKKPKAAFVSEGRFLNYGFIERRITPAPCRRPRAVVLHTFRANRGTQNDNCFEEDHANDAWDNLIEAQGHVSTAIKAHDKFSYLEKYADKLSELEHLLFPRQSFCSPGMIVRESECSICKQDYGECDHIKGMAYMGELCVRIIKKAEFRELSLVENPANKHARITFCRQGGNRDMMTWRIKKETPEEPILSEREVELTFPTNIPG